MVIKINRNEKIVLLKALKDGFLDTDLIPEIKIIVDKAQPARILTKEEAKEYINQVENEC